MHDCSSHMYHYVQIFAAVYIMKNPWVNDNVHSKIWKEKSEFKRILRPLWYRNFLC